MSNDEKIECCSNCKSLFLKNDDNNIDVWCGKCGEINGIEELENIESYIDTYGFLWNLR
jgi:phage FluMu protein Com